MVPATVTQPQPNEIRLVPTSALPANHYIYVNIVAALQSTTSVPATATAWYEYTGTTSDSTTPVVTSAVPMNGETGVGVNVQPGVIFNKPIDPVSVNSSTFQVLNGVTPLAGSYWFNSSDTRVEFIAQRAAAGQLHLTMVLELPRPLQRRPRPGGQPGHLQFHLHNRSDTRYHRAEHRLDQLQQQREHPHQLGDHGSVQRTDGCSTFTNGQPGNCGNFYIEDTCWAAGIASPPPSPGTRPRRLPTCSQPLLWPRDASTTSKSLAARTSRAIRSTAGVLTSTPSSPAPRPLPR
jgi:hypothetical protein